MRPARKKYFELCINYGKWERRLGEIDISAISTDGELFRAIRSKYEGIRGFRTKKLYLLEPVDIHFVQVRIQYAFPANWTNELLVQPGRTISTQHSRETRQLAFAGRAEEEDLGVQSSAQDPRGDLFALHEIQVSVFKCDLAAHDAEETGEKDGGGGVTATDGLGDPCHRGSEQVACVVALLDGHNGAVCCRYGLVHLETERCSGCTASCWTSWDIRIILNFRVLQAVGNLELWRLCWSCVAISSLASSCNAC